MRAGAEPIAEAWLGEDIARVERVFTQLLSELEDAKPEALDFCCMLGTPHFPQERGLRDGASSL